MRMNDIELRPSYWANVSGGKDSLFMLGLIFANPDKYPLDGVVHFELETDYPFVKNVVQHIQEVCKKHGVKFISIKPRKTWTELYNKYGYPSRKSRWCNSAYKLDAARQLNDYMLQFGKYVVSYIGYCADEINRINKRGDKKEVYPLLDFEISECFVHEWAKKQMIFNNYYIANRRCGCMGCPLASKIEWAYMYKYYPSEFENFINLMSRTENEMSIKLGRDFAVMSSNTKYNAQYIDMIVKTKWIYKLNDIEKDYFEENEKIAEIII